MAVRGLTGAQKARSTSRRRCATCHGGGGGGGPEWGTRQPGPCLDVGNSSPGIKARAILALHGLCRAPGGQHHPLLRGFLQVIEVDAAPQGAATQSRIKVSPITVSSAVVAGAANHQTSMNITVVTLGLLLSGEPGTTGGGVREGDDWTRDLARHWSPQPFVVASREHGTS